MNLIVIVVSIKLWEKIDIFKVIKLLSSGKYF